MTILLWIIAIILIIFFLDHYGLPLLGCFFIFLFYAAIPLLIFGSLFFLWLYFQSYSSKNEHILQDNYQNEIIEYEDNGSLAHNQCYDYTLEELEKKYTLDDDMMNRLVTKSEIYLECMNQ
jgi:hypothetical protein